MHVSIPGFGVAAPRVRAALKFAARQDSYLPAVVAFLLWPQILWPLLGLGVGVRVGAMSAWDLI